MPDTILYNVGLGVLDASNLQVSPAGSTVSGSLSGFINGGTVIPTNGLLVNFASRKAA